jgi:hypothetical protein
MRANEGTKGTKKMPEKTIKKFFWHFMGIVM